MENYPLLRRIIASVAGSFEYPTLTRILSALPPKAWNYQGSDLAERLQKATFILKQNFPEMRETQYYPMFVYVGGITGAIQIYPAEEDDSEKTIKYQLFGVVAGKNNEVLLKESFEVGSSLVDKAISQLKNRIAKVVEENQPKEAVSLPSNLLEVVAPEFKDFYIPPSVRAKGEITKLSESLASIFNSARFNFLMLLPESQREIVELEMPTRISLKKTKNPLLQEFLNKVVAPLSETLEKVKALPLDKNKSETDPATGLKVGQKVEFDHPKFGLLNGTVVGFENGKVLVRHKNKERERAGYAVVGTEITPVDPSKLRSREGWKSAPVSISTVNKVTEVIKSVTEKIHKDLVNTFFTYLKGRLDFALGLLENKEALEDEVIRREEIRIRNDLKREMREEEKQKIRQKSASENFPRIINSVISPFFQTKNGIFTSEVVPNVEEKIKKQAESMADEMEGSFISKQVEKLAAISEKRQDLKEIKVINYSFNADAIEADILLDFQNGDRFIAHTIVVKAVSPLGNPFYRYPTTFHDIVHNGQKYKKMDERWMNEVFSTLPK